eukprot:10688839-Ditylum_brightwellii.AAC.1
MLVKSFSFLTAGTDVDESIDSTVSNAAAVADDTVLKFNGDIFEMEKCVWLFFEAWMVYTDGHT